MLIIGDGPLSNALKTEIKEFGLEANVTWKGIINGNERFDWLARSRILLYPTREDSFAKSVAEALYLGIPVVASDNPHFRVVYNDTLLYADPENPDSYERAIRPLLSDVDLYKKYSEDSRAFAHSLPPKGNYAEFRNMMTQE